VVKTTFFSIGTPIGLEKTTGPATSSGATASNQQKGLTLQSHENEKDIRPADHPAT
jgi:hypothetical protein